MPLSRSGADEVLAFAAPAGPPPPAPEPVFRFGPFILEPSERRLTRQGRPVDLVPKAFDTLVALVERRGRLTSKEELLAAVWPDVVVEDNYLAVNVSKVRHALGDDAQRPRYVETVPRSGYRFVGEVEEVWPDALTGGPGGDSAGAGAPRFYRGGDQPGSGRWRRLLLLSLVLVMGSVGGLLALRGRPDVASAGGVAAVSGIATDGALQTDVPAAREAYLRARVYLQRRTGADLRRALDAYRVAAEADPSFAEAYAGMAEVYALLIWYAGMWPDETMPRARAAADRALALDPTLADALVVRGMVAWLYDRDPAAGERLLRSAVQQAPALPAAHQNLGLLLARVGREEEALAHLERARGLDPLNPVLAVDAASVFLYTDRYEEAIRRYRAVLDLEPGFLLARVFLALAYEASGRPADAVAEAETAIEQGGRDPLWLALLGRALASAGRAAEARAVLDELDSLPSERFVSPVAVALIHEGLGDRARTLDELERAEAERDPLVVYTAAHPFLRGLHGEQRFEALVARLGYARWPRPPVADRRPAADALAAPVRP